MSTSITEETNKKQTLNYENQAVSYIKKVITKEKIQSDVAEEIIEKFRHTDKLAILKQTLNKERPLDVLFTNPILGYNNLLSNAEADNFFKHKLLEIPISQGDELVLRGAIWNIVSSENLMNKVSDTAIREVLKVFLDSKDISKVKLILSSQYILNKIDNIFIKKFLVDIKPFDYNIVSALFFIEGMNEKFNSYLKNQNGEELNKTFNDISYGLIATVKKLISSDEIFKQKVIELFSSKITNESIKYEITKTNSAYIKLVEEVPELMDIVKSKISSLAASIEKLNAKELMVFLKSLHGESVRIIFKQPDNKECDQIKNKIKTTLFDKNAIQKNIESWIITLNNEMVELLAQDNLIQKPFIDYIKSIEEKKVKYLSRQLVNEGKIGLFKIMAEAENGEFIESMDLPGELIFSAVTNKKFECLEYLFGSEYFSGKHFESESPEQERFFDRYATSLEAARVTKDFKSLQILTDNFPKEYELDTSDERSSNDGIVSKFQLYRCQVKHIEQFGFEVKKPSNMQQYPDPCLKSPIFNDLAKGAELNPLDINDLNATLNQQIEHYALLLNNVSPYSEVSQPERNNALTNNEPENYAASYTETIKNYANYSISYAKDFIYAAAKYSAYALPKIVDIALSTFALQYHALFTTYDIQKSPINFVQDMPINYQYWIFKTTFDNLASAAHYAMHDKFLTSFTSNIYNFGGYIFTSWLNSAVIATSTNSPEKGFAMASELFHTYAYAFYLYDQYSQYNTPYNNMEQEIPKLPDEQLYHPQEDL